MIKRELRIQNFRNLGLKEELHLLINPYLNNIDTEHGDIVIIVGPNNIGKSNVLDALELSTSDENFDTNKDINDDEFERDNPALPKLILSNKEAVDVGIKKSMESNTAPNQVSTTLVPHDFLKEYTDEQINLVLAFVKQLDILKTKYPNSQDIKAFCNSNEYKNLASGDLFDITKSVLTELYNLVTDPSYSASLKDEDKNNFLSFIEHYGFSQAELNKTLEDKYKIKLIPKVYRYVPSKISKDEFTVDRQDISNIEKISPFICSILNYLKIDISDLKAAYAKAKRIKNNDVFDSLEKKIKPKMREISNTFNNMFPLEAGKGYEFGIKVDSGSTGFTLKYGNEDLDYDKQSQGFKWFFEFYFNLIVTNNLEPNDIVILDEPCATIHENGIKAYRDTIKEFSNRTGITFVVVTHRASFINVDYLDEVRVLSREGGIVKITNEFNSLPGQNLNVLKPILNSLLAGRNMLFDNRTSFPIFVEGVTDYCYLTGYKNSHYKGKRPDLIFLPVEGIKHSDLLSKIEKQEFVSILLVDSDAEKFDVSKEKSNKVMLIKLNDIDDNFHNIEDLFSKEDREKYNLGDSEDGSDPEKKFHLSHYVKREFTKDSAISSETLKNFEKVFNYLAEKIKKISVQIVLDDNSQELAANH